ncbi:MAG: class I SAM-dependent methyltransferase [Chloroflexi bacterium]|nr:class I SAM-dependent methyltransferase [Chloroflexota bacterium]
MITDTETEHSKSGTVLTRTDLQKTLDYRKVRRHWNQVRPSPLGPYMMEGFGFPKQAGHFRFRGERKIVDGFMKDIPPTATVLDLGSGAGYWTDYFAKRFDKVISVESSSSLYKGLVTKVQTIPNARAIRANALEYKSEERFGVVFLGGLLMYLNEPDVANLLRKISTWLTPGGIIICRESTVRQGTVTRKNDYQVILNQNEVEVKNGAKTLNFSSYS